nr:four helix bundle protein [Portibacter marinus]
MSDYKQLKVWQKAHLNSIDIYEATKQFPKEEMYGLTSQLRRASASVGINLVEGQARNTTKDFLRFIYS